MNGEGSDSALSSLASRIGLALGWGVCSGAILHMAGQAFGVGAWFALMILVTVGTGVWWGRQRGVQSAAGGACLSMFALLAITIQLNRPGTPDDPGGLATLVLAIAWAMMLFLLVLIGFICSRAVRLARAGG